MSDEAKADSKDTDAVTQVNVKVLGEAPAMAMGSLYQTVSHALGLAVENATSSQMNMQTIAQAATTQGVMQIYGIAAVAPAEAAEKILGGTANFAAPQPPTDTPSKP